MALWLVVLFEPLASAQTIPVIIDTDFAMPPVDDALALMLALQSPELDILGITTVSGNVGVERATREARQLLTIAGRSDIPLHRGAAMPLVHTPGPFARESYGTWYEHSHGADTTVAAEDTATAFITETISSKPNAVTLIALGPLTNIAKAIRSAPTLAKRVRRLVVMGGAFASLPDGGGNLTPNAEFNFWVDPEAAHVVLTSGIPIEISPLNVARKYTLSSTDFGRFVARDTPFTALLKQGFVGQFDGRSRATLHLYDPIAIASVIAPDIVETVRFYVDVDVNHDINYGVSVGGSKRWPGAELAEQVDVQADLNSKRFLALLIERIQRALPAQTAADQAKALR